MIVECSTAEQVEDVIKTEKLNFILYWKDKDENVGLDIYNSEWSRIGYYKERNYDIISYEDWKEMTMKILIEKEKSEMNRYRLYKELEIAKAELNKRILGCQIV